MTNVLHLLSGLIVSRSECHKVVTFFGPKRRVAFPVSIHMFQHSAILPSPHVGTTFSKLQNLPKHPIP